VCGSNGPACSKPGRENGCAISHWNVGTHDALRSTVSAAAKITVADSSTGKPVFVPWVDLRETYGSTARSGPPMRETESPAVPVPETPELVPEAVP
jgi:hypothetical protein